MEIIHRNVLIAKSVTADVMEEDGDLVLDRRLAIDGVAGAGKTFILGQLLSKVYTIHYLVKKKAFLESVKMRFGNPDNFEAGTIDAFLMRIFQIRDLDKWINEREYNLEILMEKATRLAIPYDQHKVFFIDEYSIIERSLILLLNIILRKSQVIIVGGSNQLSAIGDSNIQPWRTLVDF
ncbi:hypothetical protein RF55_12707 [Lasius niger]|uniref:Uncharacterized protein n=1 Tax=Lasius niger TaxID=67767 RepID=A0A0J7N5B4_LASNI|nr:hypothetical protein RF55_12707 [Lasius niger]